MTTQKIVLLAYLLGKTSMRLYGSIANRSMQHAVHTKRRPERFLGTRLVLLVAAEGTARVPGTPQGPNEMQSFG